MRTPLISLAIASLSVPGFGASYYLAPSGSDNAPGTATAPWLTLAKANATLLPGDTATLHPGQYAGTIAPARSGAAGKPITYRSAKRYAAEVSPAKDGAAVIAPSGRSHLVIEDFRINTGGMGGWVYADRCGHLTIRGCYLENARHTAQINRSAQVRLLDNVFTKDQVGGNMVSVRECSFVLIEGNSFTRVGHSPLQITTCRNVVVRANCFRNNWGRNYEFWASGRVLVEGNVVTQARDSAYSADSRAKNLYIDSIFRFNRVFGNLHTPLNSGSYMPKGARSTKYFREPFRLLNSRIYHNTITGNLGNGWQIYGMNISGNTFMNNVFHRNDSTGAGVQFLMGDGLSHDNRIRHNVLAGEHRGQTTVLYRNQHWTTDQANARTRSLQGFWSEFDSNVDADPAFADAANDDFRLTDGSGAADVGGPLSLAIGSGKGTELPVTDGRPFFDGFGIEGEKGDWIAVGKGSSLARVLKVELRYYQPAILHLDREVAWTDGLAVSLPWAGARSDAGAYELNGSHPTRFVALANPARPRPGEAVTFRIDPLDKEVESVRWDFADGTVSHDRSPKQTYRAEGTHGVIVRARFANREDGVEVVFVKVAAPVDPKAPLVEADFENATKATKWGYHFKYYRSWLTGYAHVAKPDGEGKCMHLFYQKKKAHRAAGAVAPGAWEIDRYPIVRFSYRIPKGVPVGICVQPFTAPGLPKGMLLGGTDSRVIGDFVEVDTVRLADDGQWHDATVDLRKVRRAAKDLKYLYRFMFSTNWRKDEGQEFWYDDFSILPAE